MPSSRDQTTVKKFEDALARSRSEKYVLKLYITGMTGRSSKAIENLRAICETYLKGRYELEIIDISQNSELALDEQIIAAPTLLRKLPLPLRRLVGDLSNEERVLVGLDLRPKD